MRKSTRIVSLVLVLLMLVGMMPLALFAADEGNDGGAGAATSAVYHDGKPVGLPTDQQLADAGLINKLRLGLDSFVMPESDEDGIIDVTTATGLATGSLSLAANTAKAIYLVKEADDNIAISLGNGSVETTSTSIQSYLQANLGGKTNGSDFVFQMDVKLTEDYAPVTNSLMTAMSRVKGDSPVSVNLLTLNYDGSLADGAGHSVGRLNSGTYTTVAAKVDLTQNKYWIYVNGVCQYAEGVTFLTDATVAEFQKYLDAGTGVDESKYGFAAGSTYDVTRYWLEGIRILQSATTTDGAYLLPDRSLLMDNFAIYYKATGNGIDYVGEFEASADEITDAFISENGYFYYVKDGYRLANGTFAVEGGSNYKFEKDGKVLSVAERVALADLVKQFTNPSNDTKYAYDGITRNGLYLAQYPINSDTYFYRGSGSSAPNIGLTANSSLAAADILSYDTVELNLYTEEVQKNTYFALLINYEGEGTSKPRIRCEFNLSAGAITGYNTSGAKSTFGGGIAAPVDGWGSVKCVNVIKEKGITDIATEDLVLTSIVAYAKDVGGTSNYLDANKNVMLNANSMFALTSVNLVKFGEAATSVSEISGGGWVRVYDPAAETADTYYYAPWKHEYVKDTVIEDKGVGYAFDADGKLTGYADGVHKVQDGKTYLYMNGEKAYGNADGKVTYKGVTYRVYGDGVVSTASVIPFFDYGYTYDNAFTNCTRNESTVYVNNAIFDDLKINGKETGFYGVHSDAGYTSGGTTTVYNNLYLTHKFSSFELLYKEGSTSDKALRIYNWGNHYFDAYVNYKPSSAQTNLVIEYDVKLGTDWDTTGSMMQLISRYEKSAIFNALTRIDQTGIVYLDAGNKSKLAKVSTEEYTRFSYVFRVVDTGTTGDITFVENKVDVVKNVSLYDVYADVYVNGVKLVSNVLLVNDRYVPDMTEFRMFQYGNANTGSIYLDNLCTYVADAPQYVADVELKNGFVKEGNIVRYYENSIMKVNTTFEAAESVDGELVSYKADGYGALSANNGLRYIPLEAFTETGNTATRVEYGYKGYNGNVLIRDELIGYEFHFEGKDTDVSSYDRLLVDIYLPEDTWTGAGKPADSYLNLVVGENERFYPLI